MAGGSREGRQTLPDWLGSIWGVEGYPRVFVLLLSFPQGHWHILVWAKVSRSPGPSLSQAVPCLSCAGWSTKPDQRLLRSSSKALPCLRVSQAAAIGKKE